VRRNEGDGTAPLVEDRNENCAPSLRKALERAGYAVDEAPDGTAAIQKVRARRYLLVITDLKMPGASGLDVWRRDKARRPTIVIFFDRVWFGRRSGHRYEGRGVSIFCKAGGSRPFETSGAARCSSAGILRENLLLRESTPAFTDFPASLASTLPFAVSASKFSASLPPDSTALLLGESGTGKGVVLRAPFITCLIDASSPFALNCAAIPNGLVENDCSGMSAEPSPEPARVKWENGPGHRGTLLLDEIGELPGPFKPNSCACWKTAFRTRGGTQLIEVDVRIVVATIATFRS